jgi:cellulose biosynthesis protein BcsQ
MKILVCYPMKSLAKTYMPVYSDVLVAESAEEFSRLVQLYMPEATVIFSEMFNSPVWEWLPALKAQLPPNSPLIIVPLYRDEKMIEKVAEESGLEHVYLLSAHLSQEEIRHQISLILGLMQECADIGSSKEKGLVYALLSYGASGITTFCINYPVILARQHPEKRIVVLDMNDAKPDLTRFFKLQQHQLSLFRPDFIDIQTTAKRNWSNVCKQSAHLPNLYYAHAASKWKSSELSNLISVFRMQFDYVYVDWGYCFPESETLQRLLHTVDRNLLFVRADPFSIDSAREWLHKWRERGVKCEVLLSHLDPGQPFRIGEDVSVYGVVPRISEIRLMQSHQSCSVLIEEFFPPKSYISSLKEIAKAQYMDKSAVFC